MSAAEDYMRSYRVKFVDVRVNPPGGRRKAGAYVQRCEHKGCDELGLCKAPKPFSARVVQIPGQNAAPEDHHWFCQRHAAEYNENFDFFDGMTEDEITAFQASAGHGHKPTWRMGGGPIGAEGRAARMNNPARLAGREELALQRPCRAGRRRSRSRGARAHPPADPRARRDGPAAQRRRLPRSASAMARW